MGKFEHSPQSLAEEKSLVAESGKKKEKEEKESIIERITFQKYRQYLIFDKEKRPDGESQRFGEGDNFAWFDKRISQLFVDAESFQDFKNELLSKVKPELEERFNQELINQGAERRIYNQILSDFITMPEDKFNELCEKCK